MPTFAIQYLEASPALAAIDPLVAQARLQAAFQTLPISYVLIGWQVPRAVLDACVQEAERADATLYRWHPLLTGDGTFVPRPEWQTIGLDGEPIPGFHDMPEFTFVCPNRPQVLHAILEHVNDLLGDRRYRGFFLDRIRYPSPAQNPSRFLACFCEDCQKRAWEQGLSLIQTQRLIRSLLSSPEGARTLLNELLDQPCPQALTSDIEALRAFLRFRADSVTRFVAVLSEAIRTAGLEVGLDCFSPAMTRMVGQDLTALDAHCEWIKTMSYGHTMGPAGLPFELLGLATWLVDRYGLAEQTALSWLSTASGLSLPDTRKSLLEKGLTPQDLEMETRRASLAGVTRLLAGIELVDLEGVTRLSESQIKADLVAHRSAGAQGLALSWDLWHIPLRRLEQVSQIWR